MVERCICWRWGTDDDTLRKLGSPEGPSAADADKSTSEQPFLETLG